MAYTWPNGSRGHTISWETHLAHEEQARADRQNQQNAFQAAAANRGPNPSSAGILGPNPLAGPGAPQKGLGSPLGGPAPAPAAPARKPFQFVPDSGYNDTIALNKKRYDDALTALQEDERTTKFDYGFDDPTNPFSRATEQKRQFLAAAKSSTVNMNSAGHLFSGANLRAIARNKRNEDKASAALRQAYEAALTSIRRAKTKAETDKEDADLRARQESFDRQWAAYNAS